MIHSSGNLHGHVDILHTHFTIEEMAHGQNTESVVKK